ncbi:hypothetical protein RRG08_045151 [Elysia crispata]|uniref:Uncharacterized protein n=1 Tax=Elysia crispata TaxID=231223 RepID=A0AAE1A3V3_9GAST|nr:hypothetical protein RRG08_045151 [Elysia crispata]
MLVYKTAFLVSGFRRKYHACLDSGHCEMEPSRYFFITSTATSFILTNCALDHSRSISGTFEQKCESRTESYIIAMTVTETPDMLLSVSSRDSSWHIWNLGELSVLVKT